MTYRIVIEYNIPDVEKKLAKSKIPEDIKKDMTNPSPKRAETIENKSSINTKAVSGMMTAYNLSTKVTGFMQQSISQNYELNGDFVSARRFQNNIQVGQEIINGGLALGLGFALGGPVGIAAVGVNLAINYAFKAMSVALENQKLFEQQKVQSTINSTVRQRFVNNATTERLK